MPDIDEILLDTDERMDKAVEAYRHTLDTVRTGRASTALVEHIHIEQYGQQLSLNQVATLAAPDAQLITIQPWDKSAIAPIMKAIQTSDLGINPSNDGTIIRLPIPPLTEQRRRELAKQVSGKSEEARVAIRNIRRHAMDELKKAQRAGEVSEDDERRAQEDVEKVVARHTEQVEQITRQKEQELLAI